MIGGVGRAEVTWPPWIGPDAGHAERAEVESETSSASSWGSRSRRRPPPLLGALGGGGRREGLGGAADLEVGWLLDVVRAEAADAEDGDDGGGER